MGETAMCGRCMEKAPAYAEARAVFRYDEGSRSQVLAFKYHDKTQMAPIFGAWLARAGSEYREKVQAILPVPLHYWRRLGRRCWGASTRTGNESAGMAGRVATHTRHRDAGRAFAHRQRRQCARCIRGA